MKYVILLCDGMSDTKVPMLGDMTPMEKAFKPNMDRLSSVSELGLCKTVPVGMKPGSDVANLSAMGYNPETCYSGRSPLEAASMGVIMENGDIAIRCNLVTLSDEADYTKKTMLDYCADDISTAEASELIKALEAHFGNDIFTFHAGISYRHCLIWKSGKIGLNLTPPHDITDKVITQYLNNSQHAEPLLEMMKASFAVLSDHPINKKRMANGKRPANSIWLWGEGTKPTLSSFYSAYGIKGSAISAVDLIKGIGKCAEMNVPNVEGATGYIDTNFEGKALAALKELANGQDLVFLHIEAPDECGHRGETLNKVKAIELIDSRVLGLLLEGLAVYDDYKILIMPDHPTPLATKTHSSDPVPYLIYQKSVERTGTTIFSEATAAATGKMIDPGYFIMKRFIEI